jgi:SPP1 family phage portal protein
MRLFIGIGCVQESRLEKSWPGKDFNYKWSNKMTDEVFIYSGQDIINMINLQGEKIMSKIITDSIEAFKSTGIKLKSNWDRYTTDQVPIRSRPDSSFAMSSNLKLNNDFAGDIVDEFKGFVFGEKIKTIHPEESANNVIKDFVAENSLEALDTELAEYMLACGYGSRVLYVEAGTGILKIMNTKPWQTIFFQNDSTEEIDYAMIFYDWIIVDPKTGKAKKSIRVEWYDKANVSYFIKDGGKFILETGEVLEHGDITTPKNPTPHLFDFVPVIKFKPNPREQSAFHKVTSDIDAYDQALSDWINEITEFRAALLVATGGAMDEEERIKAKKSGMVNLPDSDSSLTWLTKDINPDFIEKGLKTLEQNIYRFSKTVDMTNEKFVGGGPESGESRKWRLLKLIFEGIVIEQFFTKGLRTQYKILCSAWNKKSLKIDYKLIQFTFTRKLPVDLLYEMNVLTTGFGKMPIEDIYTLLSFVKDPKNLAKRFALENPVDLNTVQLLNDDNQVGA